MEGASQLFFFRTTHKFTSFGVFVTLLIPGRFNPQVQKALADMHLDSLDLEYIDRVDEDWHTEFTEWARTLPGVSMTEGYVTGGDFMDMLQQFLNMTVQSEGTLRQPYKHFENDLAFNSDRTALLYVRTRYAALGDAFVGTPESGRWVLQCVCILGVHSPNSNCLGSKNGGGNKRAKVICVLPRVPESFECLHGCLEIVLEDHLECF